MDLNINANLNLPMDTQIQVKYLLLYDEAFHNWTLHNALPILIYQPLKYQEL